MFLCEIPFGVFHYVRKAHKNQIEHSTDIICNDKIMLFGSQVKNMFLSDGHKSINDVCFCVFVFASFGSS